MRKKIDLNQRCYVIVDWLTDWLVDLDFYYVFI